MRYGSLCSGIEAATVAWHPLGWHPMFFAEIEKFPSAVLAHHYPAVSNLGDITKFRDWPDAAIDVLVGGTPCQSFSVAGLRKGLADPRGNLALTYLAIANRYRPEWLVWENVPGVLSSSDGRDFGAFLGGLAELGYGFAYRVLDAQYVRVDGFGRAVPQRRRRVFVVGNSRDWRRAGAVLFERESLSGNPAPRREAGERVAHTIAASLGRRGGQPNDHDPAGGLIASTGSVAHCLNAGGMGRIDYETETMIAHSLRAEGFDASEDGTGRGTPIVPVIAKTLTRGAESAGKGGYAGRRQEDDDNLVAFQGRGSNLEIGGEVAGTLGSNIDRASGGAPCLAFDLRGREHGAQFEGPHHTANIRAASGGSSRSYVAEQWAVRRLTPVECERLQGFPDGYTNIKSPTPDGPRYKALGNSMAVNVMRWLGRRIDLVAKLASEKQEAA